MLIKRVVLNGHPGVGDVDISFCDDNGSPYRTVVLAGGNGTGKTAILEAIQTTLEARHYANIGTIHLHVDFEDNGHI